ncbi:golgin subfamily B member 1-like isoform X2 [Chelonus insularis]|uniref:golgin subfamily B member 1-like isoform X2 n=1 Tax=Chelonus insularis TaxID=460826 RepID=UPI0015895A9E|nr:golgin subfamily B member 1-like isoform X2 [Chelonus insularis]
MSGSSEKPKDVYDNETMNVNLSSSDKDEKCEISNELSNYRDIMLKNQFDLKKKEEEVQGYAEKLTKIKSKVKSSRHSTESTSRVDESDDSIHNISDARTPSEKSLLLKKKLEENRKIFEQRNKELNESKRAAEVQVEKILQQLNDSSSDNINIPLVNPIDDKDKQISELNSKINELESIIIDLKDSLSNKDAVIESKTKAITLVTDNLSQKSKVTLDKLEDTKDEMRHMQETFIATEEGFRMKINNLLSQLQERDSTIIEYEDKIKYVTSENDQLRLQNDHFNLIISNKDKQIIELEEKFKSEEDLHNLINEKDNQIAKLQNSIQELNHNMIKIKAQSKSKLKNLQERLDSYYKSSSSNEEEVNLVNKVAILEEEIAVNDDLKKRITELEDQLAQKTDEVQSYNNAIVALENQKFELIQELHEVKQELLTFDSLKCVEFEEKEELCNQNQNKDVANDVTQNNLELLRVLNELQNQVNVVLNEKSALEEKFNKFTLYLNSNNEILTELQSEIIDLRDWNDGQCHVIQKILADLNENQLESSQKNYLLDYHQGLSDKNRNLELKVVEIRNSIDIFRNVFEHLTHDKNVWNNKFFFKNIDISDINALENLNIINLLSDNSFIPNNNSYSENNLTEIEKLIKILDLDKKHIDNSKLVINELVQRLEESDHDKLLINKLASELDGLSSNMIEERNSLTTIINDTSLEDKEIISYKKLKILDKIQQKNELITLLFEAMSKLTQNVEPNKAIRMLLDESILPNFKRTSDETINSIQLLLNDQSILEIILSLITENFVNAIVEEKEKLDHLETQMSSVLSDRDKLKKQLQAMDEEYGYGDEIKQKWDTLKTELDEKEKMIETMTAEKMKLKGVEIIAGSNNECIKQISELEKKLSTISKIVEEQKIKFLSIESESEELKEKINMKEGQLNYVDKWLAENEEFIHKIRKKESEIALLSSQAEEKTIEEESLTLSDLTRINELAVEVKALEDQMKFHESILEKVFLDSTMPADTIANKIYNFMQGLQNKNNYLEKEIEEWKKKLNQTQNHKQVDEKHEGEKLDFDTENKDIMLESEGEASEQLEKIEKDSTLVLDDKRMLEDEIKLIDNQLESVSELHNKIATLENQLIEKDQLNNNNVIRINELTDEIVNLKETLVVCEGNLSLALKDKEILENQMREKEEKLQSMNEKYHENEILRYELENKMGIIQSIENEKLALENQLIEAKKINENNLEKNDKLSYEIDVLNKKLVEYEQNYLSILNDKKALENEVKVNDEKLKSINVLQKKIENLHEGIVNREQTIETMQSEKTMLEMQLREQEHCHQENITKINQLSNEIIALNQRLAEYDEHFTMVLNDKQSLTEQLKVKDEKLASINELNGQIEQLTNAIKNKEINLESLLGEKNSLENELRQKIEFAQDNALRIDELTSEISQLLKKNEEYQDQIQKSNEKLNSMNEIHGQIEELNQKLKNKHAEIQSIVNEKNILESQLNEKEQMHQDSLVKIYELSNELDISHQQLAEQKENLTKIMNSKEILENELKMKDEKLMATEELHQRIQQLSIEKEEQHAENLLKINVLSNEIDTLKKQITDYERDIAAISSDKEILENEIIQRNEQLKAMNCLKDQIEVLHTELTGKNHLIESLTTEKITLEEKLQDIENLKEKVDQLNTEIVNREVTMEEILKEKNILMEQLEEKEQLNKTNAVKIEELKKEIESAQLEISKRACNTTSLLDNIKRLEQELKKAKEKSSDDREKLGTMLDNIEKSIDNQVVEDKNKISWLEQELESTKKHNFNQMQKMKIIAANLKKKTNQCQEFESAAKEFKEKWENEISEKKELNMKLEMLESNLNDKDIKIAEFSELLKKRENDLQYLKEKIDILESDINNRVVQFNNLREKIVTELENCKKEHLVDESLKETYRKILDLGIQVKEIELCNISDWSLLGLLKSESEDLFSDSYVNELQENTGIDYSDKYNMFEFVASKIIEDAGTNRKDFKSIISKMAEKYVIIESLNFKNKKLTEIINSIHTNRQVPNEELQSPQMLEPLETATKVESVSIVTDAIVEEKTGHVEENIEEENQSTINFDDEEVWGWNEENTGPSEFKIPLCTPETQIQIKIAELEDKVKDLQDKKMEVDEELKVIQIKNKKLIKKLQEYKIQNYNLQQQITLQSNSSKLNDLDYTIEEELKSQITQLETNLKKLREDNEKISTERDNLSKKIEILTTTKDELNKTMTMKNNELMMQIQHLSQSIQSNDSVEKISHRKSTDSESGAVNQDKCIEHEEKISKLEENLNEILSENNELKALIDTYETELNLKTKEMENLSSQTEYSKLNFFNMLEESNSEKKECSDNLSDVFTKSENVHANHQSTLEKERLENDELKATISTLKEVERELNEKISKLEQDLQEKKNEINAMELSFNHLESLWNSEIKKRAEMEQEHEEIRNKLRVTEEELKEVSLINESKLADNKVLILSLQNHINTLKQKIEDKNNEIIIINSTYNDLKHIYDEQVQNNQEVQSRYDEIVAELKLKTGEFDQQFLEKDMKIENLEQSLKETLESLHSKAQELNDLEYKLRDLQNSSKIEASESISELQTVQLVKTENIRDQEIQTSEEIYEKSIKEHENYSKSYENLQRQLAEVNEAMTNVTALLNIRVQEVADLKQYIKKLEFDKMAVDNANTELNSDNLKLNDKNQELTHHLNKLKEELDEKNQVILSLEAKLIELQALHDGAISDLNNQSLEIKSLKDVINNNEILIQNLEANVADRDTQISNVREELSDCHHKIEELSTMISDLQNSMISPKKFNEKLHEIKQLEETIETMKEEHSMLTDEYEKKLSENTIALDELKSNLSIKSEEVEDLKFILNDNTYPGMIQELQDKIDHLYEEKQQLQLSVAEKTGELSFQTNRSKNSPNNDDPSQVKDSISSELDAALYMLHQRDVRCEELTHELLQLLEERDTLQLRLSNAIKINEELKKYTPSTSKVLADDIDSGGESASSSTTHDKPLEPKEDMEVLNQKLSQLHNVNYHRDIRLIDERESRHIQQMSVIPHKNTLNPSSTDSSARIIDANYTVSRDVQSQPNVLLNWLWGKSTPKVTHM